MKINISSVLKNEGAVLPVSGAVEIGVLNYLGNSFTFASPVKVEGRLQSVGGTLELTGSVSGEYTSLCDLCGAPVSGTLYADFDERLSDDLHGCDEECFALNGATLDISGLINTLIWSNLPMKVLCREDCKGLCSVCGCNLNETVCNCETGILDPRLAIFRERAEEN